MNQNNTTKIANPLVAELFFNVMNDLDQVMSDALFDAPEFSLPTERLADYLAVKAANDQIREKSVGQLLAAFELLAEHANRNKAAVTVDRIDAHRFEINGSRVSGSSLKFRHGVRCLTVEAGWTRTPSDGFMRGNALALARISHFGIPSAGMELRLLKFDDVFRWFRLDSRGVSVSIELEDLISHFRTFLG